MQTTIETEQQLERIKKGFFEVIELAQEGGFEAIMFLHSPAGKEAARVVGMPHDLVLTMMELEDEE